MGKAAASAAGRSLVGRQPRTSGQGAAPGAAGCRALWRSIERCRTIALWRCSVRASSISKQASEMALSARSTTVVSDQTANELCALYIEGLLLLASRYRRRTLRDNYPLSLGVGCDPVSRRSAL